ncbi:MAG: hypothetical protein F2817_15260 [Actinobacteria bacterium]|nr:hypothetical protein [Actinomycetota bacterium]
METIEPVYPTVSLGACSGFTVFVIVEADEQCDVSRVVLGPLGDVVDERDGAGAGGDGPGDPPDVLDHRSAVAILPVAMNPLREPRRATQRHTT